MTDPWPYAALLGAWFATAWVVCCALWLVRYYVKRTIYRRAVRRAVRPEAWRAWLHHDEPTVWDRLRKLIHGSE